MSYINDYDKIFDISNEKWEELLENQKIIKEFNFSDFQKKEKNGLKYLSLKMVSDENPVNFAAFLYICFINKKELFEEKEDELFPLMFIITPTKIQKKAEKYNNQKITFNHEFMHLKDMLEIYDKDPEYIKRGSSYAYANISKEKEISEEKISECLKYEIEKIFLLEPQAMKLDYESGENIIPIPFLFRVVEYYCKNSEEYIKMRIFDYLQSIKSKCESIYQTQNIIEHYFEKYLNVYGKNVFGENAYTEYIAFDQAWVQNVLENANRQKDSSL